MNAVGEAALTRLRRSLGDLRDVVRVVPSEGLNWQPGTDTNSIAAQIAHVLKSADFLLGAAQTRSPDLVRYLAERQETFHFRTDGPTLLEMLEAFDRTLASRIETISEQSFADIVEWQGGSWQPATVAWCLLGVVEHLREHVGAAALTRQVWESFGRGSGQATRAEVT